jgi:hypothetical protein
VTAVGATRRRVARAPWSPPFPELDRRFEAVVFDWDGTAVTDRKADATELRELVEELCSLGLDLAVITGTHVGNVDGQLRARPSGPGRLYFLVNRGSEVFQADADGLTLIARREASADENQALDGAAAATVAALARRGLRAEIVSERLNRRKVDVIPEPDWLDPPKARIAELLAAVEARLRQAGVWGLREAVDIALEAARSAGLTDPRVTSDAKHLEIGLTDKSDSARWIFADLRRRGIGPSSVLVAGDEFGPLGGLLGSDSYLLVPEGAGATAVSVGAEPTGVPAGILALSGGPESFARLLEDQRIRRARGDVPGVDDDPEWTIGVEGLDPQLERMHESLLALVDGRLGTRGAPLTGDGETTPATLYAGVYDGKGAASDLVRQANWARLNSPDAAQPRARTLNLRAGLLREEGPVTSLRFSSLARPGTVVLRATADPELLPRSRRRRAGRHVTVLTRDRRRGERFERLGAYGPDEEAAEAALAEAERVGFEGLLAAHREAWGRRWDESEVLVDGDPELQRAIRFNLFHLIGAVADSGEAAVGARGLTGGAYRGHVFWDSDVFVLPFLAATHPPAARAMLEYRVRRLPVRRPGGQDAGERGSPGNPLPTAWMSRLPRRGSRPASSCASGPVSSRSTSSLTSPGPPPATWTGPVTTSSRPARDAS